MPWPRTIISWAPTNSHLLLQEGVGETLHLSEEDLAIVEAEQKIFRAEYCKARAQKEREDDLEGCRARDRQYHATRRVKDPEFDNEMQRKKRANIIERGTHHCPTCGISVGSPSALETHLQSKSHKQQVEIAAGAEKPELSRHAQTTRELIAKNHADKVYYCDVCGTTSACQAALDIHKTSKRHLKKVAALQAALQSYHWFSRPRRGVSSASLPTRQSRAASCGDDYVIGARSVPSIKRHVEGRRSARPSKRKGQSGETALDEFISIIY